MMKPYLFTLLLLIFPLNIFAQNDLSPDENRVTFILNISWLLNDNLEVLKGEYIKTVKPDSETDPELKAKANNLNVQRIIVFIKQNYEKTEVTSALTLYLISGWNLLCCRFEQCR